LNLEDGSGVVIKATHQVRIQLIRYLQAFKVVFHGIEVAGALVTEMLRDYRGTFDNLLARRLLAVQEPQGVSP
jgi:hypothetical protein